MFTSVFGYVFYAASVICLVLTFTLATHEFILLGLAFGFAAAPFERDYPSGF